MPHGRHAPPRAGFTLIEILVVMTILATLLAIAAPSYFASVAKAREAALKSDLRTLREAIDQFEHDRGRYPDSLQQLVEQRYLRAVPHDPTAAPGTDWSITAPPSGAQGAVYDVHSAAVGTGIDGTAYASW